MGHATMELTMCYAHLSPETKQEAVQLLDEGPPAATAGPHWGHIAVLDSINGRN
jgi:hypothetical protein